MPHDPPASPSSACEFVAGYCPGSEDGRLWPGGKRAGWNRGHDLATGAPLNRSPRRPDPPYPPQRTEAGSAGSVFVRRVSVAGHKMSRVTSARGSWSSCPWTGGSAHPLQRSSPRASGPAILSRVGSRAARASAYLTGQASLFLWRPSQPSLELARVRSNLREPLLAEARQPQFPRQSSNSALKSSCRRRNSQTVRCCGKLPGRRPGTRTSSSACLQSPARKHPRRVGRRAHLHHPRLVLALRRPSHTRRTPSQAVHQIADVVRLAPATTPARRAVTAAIGPVRSGEKCR